MIDGSVAELLQTVRAAIVVCFLPILLYRVWRMLRYPTSVPAIAATSFGAVVWFWLLAFTDWVWSMLPPVVHALAIGGWPTVTMAACLQVFVVGISGDASPESIRRGLRFTFVATVIALTVVTIAASQSDVLFSTSDISALINALMFGGDAGSRAAQLTSNAFLAAVLVQAAWVGFKHADRTPVGTGLALLATAAVFELVAIGYGGLWRPLNRGGGRISGTVGVWLESLPGCVGAVLIIFGFLWPPVMLRLRARRDVRRLRPLRETLLERFPRLFPPNYSRMRLSDLAFEYSMQIQDGLTLLAQARQVPLTTDQPLPADRTERVADVANWILGHEVQGFSCVWLRSPDGISEEDWVLAIADAYRDRQEGVGVPASSSGMPSTLRR